MSSVLVSSHVFLREMEEKDWMDVHKYASMEAVCKYQPWGPNSEEESKDFVNQVLTDAKRVERTRFVFSIVEKETGSMVGAGEFNIRDSQNKTGEIGYIVNPDYWGKGLATETAKVLVDFGFEQLNLHRIFATCDPRNIASAKVLEKTGMVQEGRMREDLLLKDGWRDSFLYSILYHEWKSNFFKAGGNI
ncbi:GNAT family protein [Psychrobacillus sp. NEAU-3TGS]|uniref:GNAT family N-acetyltransferase n=1 Tax=Psychrobacillus sp. NEAU-3TGS TaxID=2995412 RepID=UPI00249984CF|nr:GNAT family protein [Psychrobacillus sp. NEAU-3TGS]MDI2586700.1 GNAT family protein [Psychrobacillus sp. NEAU-3TGS]